MANPSQSSGNTGKDKAYLMLVFAALLRGGWVVLGKIAVESLSAITVGLASRGICACLCLLFVLGLGQKKELRNLQGQSWILILVGSINFILTMCVFLGLRYCTAVNGAILMRSDILFTVLIGYIIFKRGLSLTDWLSIALMIGGVLLVIRVNPLKFGLNYFGNILILLSALLIAVNAFLIKIRLRALQGGIVAFFNNLVSTICFLPFVLMSGTGRQDLSRLYENPYLWLTVSLLALCTMGILFYYYSLKRLPLWTVRTLLLFTPIVSIALSSVFLHEPLFPVQIVGMGIMLTGAFWIIWRQQIGRTRSLLYRSKCKD